MRAGCHHCGKRSGAVIADHQPPNKVVYGASPAPFGLLACCLTAGVFLETPSCTVF